MLAAAKHPYTYSVDDEMKVEDECEITPLVENQRVTRVMLPLRRGRWRLALVRRMLPLQMFAEVVTPFEAFHGVYAAGIWTGELTFLCVPP